MPDTGAPWNIPYVAGTDLVADWPTDNQQQAEAIADALDIAKSVVSKDMIAQTANQDTTSSTFVDVTDFDLDVTPATDTNEVLIIVTFQMQASVTDNMAAEVELRRDTTTLATTEVSILTQITFGQSGSIVYLDSPATTSTVNYNVRYRGSQNAARGARIQDRQLVVMELQA